MNKVIISFKSLPKNLKRELKRQYPKEEMWKYLSIISESEKEITYGLFIKDEETEYLVKMLQLPRKSVLNRKNHMNSIINDITENED